MLIFPEGTRSKTGDLLPFHPGPAILALGAGVPVLPIYIDGASNILPPKTKRAHSAAVKARIGEPIEFPPGTTIPDATHMMEEAVRSLSVRNEKPVVELWAVEPLKAGVAEN